MDVAAAFRGAAGHRSFLHRLLHMGLIRQAHSDRPGAPHQPDFLVPEPAAGAWGWGAAV